MTKNISLNPAYDLNVHITLRGVTLYATRDALCGMSVEEMKKKYGGEEIADFIGELNNLISVLEQACEQQAIMEGQNATKN